MRNDILIQQDAIKTWISEKKSKAFMCKQLKCKPETLNFWLEKLNIKYEGNQNPKGIQSVQRRSVAEYIKLDAVRSCILKQKLIEEKIKEPICEECEIEYWNGFPIPTELHHIDGNRFSNEFSNLKILCCNCHAQTDNYKKKKSAIK